MNQTLYAHMNNKRKMKKKKNSLDVNITYMQETSEEATEVAQEK
jgi:hypothetical protein